MSSAEYYELLFQLMADIDTQFQFWLTMTFAVIVTTFFASDRLTGYLRWLIVVLYVAACSLVFMRWTVAGAFMQEIGGIAGENASELPFATNTGNVRFVVFMLGTIGASLFTLLYHKIGRKR